MDLVNEINYFYYHMSLYELQAMNENIYFNGLSYNSMLYINVISQMKDCTVSRISEALKITKPAVTLKINELVRQGAVVKKQSEQDKRVYYLTLSPEMQNAVSIYDEAYKGIEKELIKKYTPKQLALFGEILHTLSGYEWRTIKHESELKS